MPRLASQRGDLEPLAVDRQAAKAAAGRDDDGYAGGFGRIGQDRRQCGVHDIADVADFATAEGHHLPLLGRGLAYWRAQRDGAGDVVSRDRPEHLAEIHRRQRRSSRSLSASGCDDGNGERRGRDAGEGRDHGFPPHAFSLSLPRKSILPTGSPFIRNTL